ncbi:MAG: hypothetical protein ABL888_16830 [Pirellulaceae bacterium]
MKLTLDQTVYLQNVITLADLLNSGVDEALCDFPQVTKKHRNLLAGELLNISQGLVPMRLSDASIYPIVSFWLPDDTLCLPDPTVAVELDPPAWNDFETTFVGFVFDRMRHALNTVSDTQYLECRRPILDVVWLYCTALDGSGIHQMEDGERYRPVLGYFDNSHKHRTTYYTPSDFEFLFLHEYVHGWADEHFAALETK